MGIKKEIQNRLFDWQNRRGLIKAFPELKGNKRELSLLVLKLSQLQNRREPENRS